MAGHFQSLAAKDPAALRLQTLVAGAGLTEPVALAELGEGDSLRDGPCLNHREVIMQTYQRVGGEWY